MNIRKILSNFNTKHCCVRLAVFAVIVSISIVLHVSTRAMSSGDINNLLPSLPYTANLTLVALNGTQYFLNSSRIITLPPITAPGGYMHGAGPPFSTNNYMGVSLNTLANLIGGLDSNEVLAVVGSDGYTRNFTYTQVVDGNFSGQTYNRTTGNPVSPTKPIVAIIAYYNNSQLIPGESNGGGGPLMVAIVGNDSLVTPGNFWVKWVDKVEVFRVASVPEFHPVSFVSLFIISSLIVVVSSVWLSRKSPKERFFIKYDEGT